MTYIAEIVDGTAIFTEFTATSHVANNSKIIWNTTPRSTGTPGIVIDSSGNITLSGGRSFWLIASLDVTANAVGMFATNITIGGSQTLSFKYTGTSNLTINTSMTLLAIEIGRT